MSNAVADVYGSCGDDAVSGGPETAVFDGALAMISPRSEVLRLLPSRARRMVGAWCFVDVFGPRSVDDGAAMHVPPHPHIGLQTVSWLAAGTVTHRDSLGSVATVVPGRAAVMTAGSGVAHAEDVVPGSGVLHGAQLWVALPEAERHRDRSFTLHDPSPSGAFGEVRVQVFVGSVGDLRAPATALTPLVGAELTGSGSGSVPLDPSFEHLLVPLSGSAWVEGAVVATGQAMYLGCARVELEVSLTSDARVLLLGGAAVRGGDRDVVELRGTYARGDRAGAAAVERWRRSTLRRSRLPVRRTSCRTAYAQRPPPPPRPRPLDHVDRLGEQVA